MYVLIVEMNAEPARPVEDTVDTTVHRRMTARSDIGTVTNRRRISPAHNSTTESNHAPGSSQSISGSAQSISGSAQSLAVGGSLCIAPVCVNQGLAVYRGLCADCHSVLVNTNSSQQQQQMWTSNGLLF